MLRKVNRSRSGKACQVIVRTWDFTLTLESFGHLGQKSDVIWNICKKKKTPWMICWKKTYRARMAAGRFVRRQL